MSADGFARGVTGGRGNFDAVNVDADPDTDAWIAEANYDREAVAVGREDVCVAAVCGRREAIRTEAGSDGVCDVGSIFPSGAGGLGNGSVGPCVVIKRSWGGKDSSGEWRCGAGKVASCAIEIGAQQCFSSASCFLHCAYFSESSYGAGKLSH